MFLFLVLSFLFLYKSNNLLLSLLILEILSFFMLYFIINGMSYMFFSDYMVMIMFSVFVMEGVIGLSGLIVMVTFTGSDYMKSSSLLKC